MNIKKDLIKEKPNYVLDLETAYGPPGQEAFGSAVFYEILTTADLEPISLETYRYFVGDLWNQYGEEAWLRAWKEVYVREQQAAGDIVAELQGLSEPDIKLSVPMILQNIENAGAARIALTEAFDSPAVSKLAVYNTGDGEAMSGLLIAARRKESSDITLLIFLMD